MEDENTDSPKDVKVQATAEPVTSTDTSPDPANVPSVSVSGPASTTQGSGRNSSEEGTAMSTSSYDVVSRTVSESEKPAAADEDEDSDWE